MPKKRSITEFEIEAIERMARDGKSQACVAKELRMSAGWVRDNAPKELLQILAANGKQMHRSSTSPFGKINPTKFYQ